MYMGSSIEFALGLPLGLRSSAHMSFACRVPDLSSPPTGTPSTAAWKSPEPNRLVGVAVFSATPFTGYGEWGRKAIVKASGGAADGDLGESPPPASAATASSSSWEGRAACTKYVCMYVSKHGAVHTHVCLSVSLSLCLFVCRPHGVYTRAHAPLCTCVYCIYICMYAHTYVCMYTRIMFVCKACVCMHVCIFAWSHEWHTPNVRCDRCSDGRVLCTCLVVNVFRWRCMGLQGLGNRLRVVICEGRISAVRSCLFLPLPRRAGCARKARSAKRHFRRVRRLRLPAHGKAVQHAPRTDFCLCLCLLKQRAFANTTARRAHVLCTCLVVNIFRRWCMGLHGLGNRLRVVICERRISAVRQKCARHRRAMTCTCSNVISSSIHRCYVCVAASLSERGALLR